MATEQSTIRGCVFVGPSIPAQRPACDVQMRRGVATRARLGLVGVVGALVLLAWPLLQAHASPEPVVQVAPGILDPSLALAGSVGIGQVSYVPRGFDRDPHQGNPGFVAIEAAYTKPLSRFWHLGARPQVRFGSGLSARYFFSSGAQGVVGLLAGPGPNRYGVELSAGLEYTLAPAASGMNEVAGLRFVVVRKPDTRRKIKSLSIGIEVSRNLFLSLHAPSVGSVVAVYIPLTIAFCRHYFRR